MANVAMNESSGRPDAHNQYTENGKTYHVKGLWQISDINGAGNYEDPLENARKAVEMHRGSGMTPWESSRTKGGSGGWQQYLDSRMSGHSESDFRNQSGPHIAGFTPAAAPPSVAAAAFAGPHTNTNDAASQGMPTALQSQLNNQPRGDKVNDIPGATARPAAGNAMKTAIDYASSPASLAVAYARDIHYQEQQKKKLSGQALADFNTKIRAANAETGTPGTLGSMKKSVLAGKPPDPDVFPNAAALAKAFDGGKGLAPDKIANISNLTTMVGDGKGSFEDSIQALTHMDKGDHGVHPSAGTPLSLQTQLSGHSVQKNTPSALEHAGPALDAAADIVPQMFTPYGGALKIASTGMKLAAVPLKALTSAARDGELMTTELPKIVASIKSTKVGEAALAHIVGISNGIQDLSSPFAAGRRVAKQMGVDPDLVEQHMRSYVGAGSKATANADKLARTVFENTNLAQRKEIERLSENFGPRGIINPPAMPDPQGVLQRKAADLRQAYHDFTNDSVALKLLGDEQVFDPHTYTFRGGGAYKEEEIPQDLQDFIDSYKSGSQKIGANTNHKVFLKHDDAAPFLKDDYDPADQLLTYAAKRGTDVGREKAIRELHNMGVISDLAILDPKNPTNILGFGAEGAQAATNVGRRDATALSVKDAYAKMNEMRTARGVAPVSYTEFAAMRKAANSSGRTRVRSEMAAQQERAMERLAGRAQKGADTQEERIGMALKQQIDAKVATVDKLQKKIDQLHEAAQQGDRAAAAKSLATAVAERDRLQLEVDGMHERVQRASEDVYGKTRPEPNKELDAATQNYHMVAEKFGVSSKEAEAAFKAIDQNMMRKPEPTSIFEPVVGRIQDIYQAAQALPPGPERSRVLKALGNLGKRGVKGPQKVADTVRAGRLIKKLQNAMSHVAAAGRDETSMRIIQELNKTVEQLTKAVTKDDERLYARKSAVASPAHRVADVAMAGNAKAAARAKQLQDKLEYAINSKVDVENFERAFSRAMKIRSSGGREAKNIIEKSEAAAANREHQVSFASVDAAHGSPTLEFAKADKDIVKFFKSQGASPTQAQGMAKFTDGMNRLARIGIITNPVVHAGWNLGTHFLAAGGPPEFFISHMWEDPTAWGKIGSKTGAEWQVEAEHWNAIVHMADTHPLFGGSYGKNMIDAPGTHGWKQGLNAGVTQLWHQNQRIVFEQFEQRYSVALFAHLVEHEHMTPQKAGIMVRKALGDYANVSRDGVEGAIRKSVLFYPWFKTAIPFWAKTLVTRPGFVALPGMGVRRWDEDMGDPDMATENPLTIDFGPNDQGGRHKMTLPSPVKFVGDITNALFPYDRDEHPISSRIGAGWKVLESHLRPWGFEGGDPGGNAFVFGAPVLGTLLDKAKQPGGANFQTVFNKDESAGVAAGQAAEHYAANLPLAGAASSVFQSVQHPDRGLEGLAGGYQYDTQSRGASIRSGRAQSTLDRQLTKAAHMPPAAKAAAITAARTAFERKTGHAPPPAPAVSIPGFTPISGFTPTTEGAP